MSDLEEKVKEAIEAQAFDFFEWTGFKKKPQLALMAGAMIGYLLATKESKKQLEELHAAIGATRIPKESG